eukprot:3113854-Ditylum_brightwellii.AAC.1
MDYDCPIRIQYYHEGTKYDSASSCCSKTNIKGCQPCGYAGGACNEGINLISETDKRENPEDNADAGISVAETI